jgi:hypothetical protein
MHSYSSSPVPITADSKRSGPVCFAYFLFSMKTFLTSFIFLSLGFVIYHQDNQLDLLRNRIGTLERHDELKIVSAAKPAKMPVAKVEEHDEKVERLRHEAMQRKKDYCNAHPNLAIRIGCE